MIDILLVVDAIRPIPIESSPSPIKDDFRQGIFSKVLFVDIITYILLFLVDKKQDFFENILLVLGGRKCALPFGD